MNVFPLNFFKYSSSILNKFLLIIFLLPNLALSQTLSGNVISDKNEPIEFAEIILFTKDSIAIKSDLTNEKGYFNIKHDKGFYILQIRQLGNVFYNKNIILENDVFLGDISIKQTSIELKEIVISSQQKIIERKNDKLIFNIEKSIYSSSGDALDALKVTPSLKIQNDKVEMIGKSAMGVLLNDKLIMLSGDELIAFLKSIPSENISKIEVISNPPAKYDAEGNGGLVNLVLKKNKTDNWQILMRSNLKQATYFSTSLGSNFSFQRKKIGLIMDIDLGNSKLIYENKIRYEYPYSYWNKYMYNVNHSKNLSYMTILNYDINDKTTIGFQYLGAYSKPLINDYNVSNVYDNQSHNIVETYDAQGVSNVNYKRNILNINGLRKINSNGGLITFDLDYMSIENDKNNPFSSLITDGNNIIQNDSVKNFNTSNFNIFSSKIDFTIPLKWLKLEWGSKLSFTKNESRIATSFIDNSTNNNYLNQNINFDYLENTQAFYFSASKDFKEKWSLKLGLRTENTQTKGVTENNVKKNKYFNFFPTAFLSYEYNENNSFSISFSRRINRPNFNYLNPSRKYSAINSYVFGNPFLRPSFSYNMDFQHIYKNLLTTSIKLYKENNTVSQISIPDVENNSQTATWENYANFRSISIDESVNYKINEVFSVYLNLYATYQEFDSNIPLIQSNGSGWTSGFISRGTLFLNKDKTFITDLTYWYDLPSKSLERSYEETSSLNISFKHFFIEKKMQATLIFNNIFKSDNQQSSYVYNGVFQSFNQYYDTSSIRFSLTYTFGNNKPSTKKRNLSGLDELSRTNN